MVLVGLITFIDPPKESARESVQLLARSGIDLKILTGDNELVTRKTCELIGVPVKGVLTGAEIENLDTEGLARVVDGMTIFSRMTPVQKNRVMNALKKNGHVVGFMGDGINDAPSIREADVGISVANAVDIAKESADIILLKNDLRILHDGVIEGRKTVGNTMKYILMNTSLQLREHVQRGRGLALPPVPAHAPDPDPAQQPPLQRIPGGDPDRQRGSLVYRQPQEVGHPVHQGLHDIVRPAQTRSSISSRSLSCSTSSRPTLPSSRPRGSWNRSAPRR